MHPVQRSRAVRMPSERRIRSCSGDAKEEHYDVKEEHYGGREAAEAEGRQRAREEAEKQRRLEKAKAKKPRRQETCRQKELDDAWQEGYDQGIKDAERKYSLMLSTISRLCHK